MLAEGHYGAIATSPQREIASIFVRAKVTAREVSRTLLLATAQTGGDTREQVDNYLSNVYVDYKHNKADEDQALMDELKRVEEAGFRFFMPKDAPKPTTPAVEGMGIDEVML